MEDTKLAQINKRFETMRTNTATWETSWKTIARWIMPTRGKFEGDEVNDGSLINSLDIVNCSVLDFVKAFASGMISGMTNPSRKWFKLLSKKKENMDNHNVKLFLEKTEDLMYDVFRKSNVYEGLYNIYEEYGIFATSGSIVLDDYDDIIRIYNFTMGEFYLATDGAGRVNTFAREFVLTVSQIVENFGIDNVSSRVKDLFRAKNFDENIEVRHCIYPREQYDVEKKDNQNMPFASVYWEKSCNENKFLSESGYELFPVLAPRWEVISTSDIYGKNSPGWFSIGDCKMLQTMQKNKLKNLALLTNPAMLVDDSIENYDLRPNGIIRVNNLSNQNVGVRPVEVMPADLQSEDASIKTTKEEIANKWYVNLFLMFSQGDDPRMTATEVMQRNAEKMLVLAPVLGQLNKEVLEPLINITFAKLLNSGILGDIPAELEGEEIEVDYISVIAQAQKMVGTKSIEQLLALVGNVMSVKPEIIDNIDFDEIINDYAMKLGVSPKLLKSKEVVDDIRKIRTETQAKMQQQQDVANMVQGAKTLSETEIKDNTALKELLG